jgi:hypothetical protein
MRAARVADKKRADQRISRVGRFGGRLFRKTVFASAYVTSLAQPLAASPLLAVGVA